MIKILLTQIICSLLLSQQLDWDDNGVALRQGVHILWNRAGDIGNPGEMIFAWADTRTSDRDIYAQKFDANGNKLWGDEGTLIVSYDGRQEDPILIHDGDGGAYIVWWDFRYDPYPWGDIYAQHIMFSGSLGY